MRRPAPRRRAGGSGRNPNALPLLAVALVSCVLYANTLTNGLVSDDAELIRNNAATHHPLHLGAILGGRYWGDIIQNDTLYRPLTTWTLAVNYAGNGLMGLPGDWPAGFHLLNLLLNAAAACAVLFLLLEIGLARWPALAGALLFATLPIHTEAVASVVGRAELLAVLFGIGFLLLHRRRRPVLAGLALLLALMSKESAIAFLLLAVGMDVGFGRPAPERRRAVVSYALAALAVAVWAGLRALAVGRTPRVVLAIDNPLVGAGLVHRVLTAAAVQLDYLRLQLVPAGLSSDYSFNQVPVVTSPLNARFLAWIAVTAAAIVLAWRLRRRDRLVGFAVTGYAILALPTSNLLMTIGTIMGERLAYAPSIFPCMLLGYGAWKLRERFARRAVPVLLGVLLVIYAGLTVARNRTWSDVETFARAQLRSAPASAKANYNAGLVAQGARRLDAAAALYRRAVEILPDYVEALNNLGIVYKDSGDLDAAIRTYQQAIAVRPSFAQSHFNLGQAYHIRGRLNLAEASYEKAIALKPDYVQAISNLAAAYSSEGRMDEAEALWRRALQIDPGYEIARQNLDRLAKSKAGVR